MAQICSYRRQGFKEFTFTYAVDNKNTKYQIKYTVKVLKQYAEMRGNCTLADVEAMPAADLDDFLRKFYPALRRENGAYYTKKSVQEIRYSLQCHFQERFDIFNGIEFAGATEASK